MSPGAPQNPGVTPPGGAPQPGPKARLGEQLVFGHGPHLCLGAHLARLQMRTLFSALLAKTTWIEPAGDPVFLRSSFQRGVKRLPVRLR